MELLLVLGSPPNTSRSCLSGKGRVSILVFSLHEPLSNLHPHFVNFLCWINHRDMFFKVSVCVWRNFPKFLTSFPNDLYKDKLSINRILGSQILIISHEETYYWTMISYKIFFFQVTDKFLSTAVRDYFLFP